MFSFISSQWLSAIVAVVFLVIFIIARFVDCGWWDAGLFGVFLFIRGGIYISQGSGIGVGALLIVAGIAFVTLSIQSS